MNYDAVIFDLDGTLLDTLDDITDGVNYALRTFGFAERSREEVRQFVGNGAVKLLERALPCVLDEKTFQRFYACYDTYYTEHAIDKTKPYDGVMSLLQRLKALGIHTAVFSNKQDNAVRPLCARYFGDLLDYATGPTSDTPKKPSPEGIIHIAKVLNTSLSRVLYVGDSETDVQTGLNVGVQTMAVLWGFRDRETLQKAGATLYARDVEDILNIIEK